MGEIFPSFSLRLSACFHRCPFAKDRLLALAQEAGAHELAPEQIERAESLLARAEEAARDEKRGAESIRLASEARSEAEVAYAVSRQAKTHEQALEEIKRCSGTQFDPDIAQVFIELMTTTVVVKSSSRKKNKELAKNRVEGDVSVA